MNPVHQVVLGDQRGHRSSLPALPQRVGKNETAALEFLVELGDVLVSCSLYLQEEGETDPLVVFVFNNLIFYGDRTYSRVGHFLTNISVEQLGEGEGGVNPAVGVHHILRHVRVNNAVNGIPSRQGF